MPLSAPSQSSVVASFVHQGKTMLLLSPTSSMERQFVSFVEEFKAAGEGHFVHEDVLEVQGFKSYVQWLGLGERGELGAGFAPWSAYWLYDQDADSIAGI